MIELLNFGVGTLVTGMVAVALVQIGRLERQILAEAEQNEAEQNEAGRQTLGVAAGERLEPAFAERQQHAA